tara:strand:+ start:1102 stop:1512 length:411 start_codon:yes stop_codon:yes gene_type:complete
LVIGKITSIGSLIIFGAVAVLFLRQASGSSFGQAGQDVGSGLTGISSGISNLFNSFISPITGLFGSLGSLFSFAQTEQSAQADNTWGYIRPEPTPATSRIGSTTATTATVNAVASGGYSAGAITSHRATGGFGRAN